MTYRQTLEFFLYDWLAAESLNQRPRFTDYTRETFDAVLNRCDDTREFMVEMWRNNPHLAKQGGGKVAMLLGLQVAPSGWVYEPSPKV